MRPPPGSTHTDLMGITPSADFLWIISGGAHPTPRTSRMDGTERCRGGISRWGRRPGGRLVCASRFDHDRDLCKSSQSAYSVTTSPIRRLGVRLSQQPPEFPDL